MITLKNIRIGSSGIVDAVKGERALRRRLLDMGITPNTMITVKKTAPMGDPLEISLRGYSLTIRLEDADNIVVKEAVG